MEAGVRFELTAPEGAPVFKTGGLNHSPNPPKNKRAVLGIFQPVDSNHKSHRPIVCTVAGCISHGPNGKGVAP
jgi:hypothetical protein